MRKQIKTPEKYLSDKEVVNLLHAEVRILVIRMLTEMTFEYSHKIKEEMMTIHREIKKNTKSERKKVKIQINNLEQKEEINIQPEQNEVARIQKKERLRNL